MIIAGGQIFKIPASRYVNVSEGEINLTKENAILRNTKHATKFEMRLLKGFSETIYKNIKGKVIVYRGRCNK